MPITDWPVNERPREKFMQRGASALSDAELLAIFLRTGIAGQSAVDLARQLLTQFGSLNGVFGTSQTQFCDVRGMGEAKYAQLQAVLEMSRRALKEQMVDQNALAHPTAVRDFLCLMLRNRKLESFVVLLLDRALRVLEVLELTEGSVAQVQVYPQEVARQALLHHASAVIVAHNHPSGQALASPADLALTQTLRQSLRLLDIQLIDHLIIAGDQIVSLAELGQI